jgi:hypothetical protein
MVMVGKYRPSFQLPLILFGERKQLIFQQCQMFWHFEKMGFIQRCRCYHKYSIRIQPMYRSMRPIFFIYGCHGLPCNGEAFGVRSEAPLSHMAAMAYLVTAKPLECGVKRRFPILLFQYNRLAGKR